MLTEFSIAGSHASDRSGPVRWILSHVWRHKRFAITSIIFAVTMNGLTSGVQWLVGEAFDQLLEAPPDRDAL